MNTRRTWTSTERDLLRKLYARGESLDYIAERLGRSWSSVNSQVAVLRVRRDEGYRRWSTEDLKQLRELYTAGVRVPVIAQRLQRTTSAIMYKVRLHKMRRGRVVKAKSKPKPKPKQPKAKTTRKVTEQERELLQDFITMFLRTYALAEKRGIHISKAEFFGLFIEKYFFEQRRMRPMGEVEQVG